MKTSSPLQASIRPCYSNWSKGCLLSFQVFSFVFSLSLRSIKFTHYVNFSAPSIFLSIMAPCLPYRLYTRQDYRLQSLESPNRRGLISQLSLRLSSRYNSAPLSAFCCQLLPWQRLLEPLAHGPQRAQRSASRQTQLDFWLERPTLQTSPTTASAQGHQAQNSKQTHQV